MEDDNSKIRVFPNLQKAIKKRDMVYRSILTKLKEVLFASQQIDEIN